MSGLYPIMLVSKNVNQCLNYLIVGGMELQSKFTKMCWKTFYMHTQIRIIHKFPKCTRPCVFAIHQVADNLNLNFYIWLAEFQ